MRRKTIGQNLLIQAGFRQSSVDDYQREKLGVIEEWRKEIEDVGCAIKYFKDGKFHAYSIEKYGDIVPIYTNALTSLAIVKRHTELFKFKDTLAKLEGEGQ